MTDDLRDESMIDLEQNEKLTNEERRAQRAKKWQEVNKVIIH